MDVEQTEIREHLGRHPPFSLVSEAWLDKTAMAVEVAYFRAGDQILSFDDEIHDLHYLRSGAVEIYRRDGELYNRLGEGEIFGQLALMTGRRARFPVRAIEDTLLYFIPESVFRQLFEAQEAFADFVEVEDRTRLRQASARHSGSNDLMTTRIGELISRKPVMVEETATVQAVAGLMAEEGVSAVMVTATDSPANLAQKSAVSRDTGMVGIVTDSDLSRRVLSRGLPHDTPVSEVMTTEVVTVRDDQFLFEALLVMLRGNIHHLPVLHRLQVAGVIDLADVVGYETQSSLFVVRNIYSCNSVEELAALSVDVRASFFRMVNEDANSHMVGSAMATIGRSFKQRLLELGEEKLGLPPVPYCFLALGSMARDEQFMFTDQDNAMILSDEFDPKDHDGYFRDLAAFVCDGLAAVGYYYCKGDVMATNTRWRQPLQVWKDYFDRWIRQPKPRALLNSAIFFDLDGVYGKTTMADELKERIAQQASRAPNFLGCLARNAQNRTPPLGFFKDFVLEKSGRHINSIDLKRRGTAPLVDVIRVHALASASRAQNSFRRLDDAVAAGFLTASMAADLRDALEFISIVRVRHQAFDLQDNRKPDNNIDPERLSAFERRTLKDAFKVLGNAQKFLKFRYRPQAA